MSTNIPIYKLIDGKRFEWVMSFDLKKEANQWAQNGRKVGQLRRIFRIDGRYRAYGRHK